MPLPPPPSCTAINKPLGPAWRRRYPPIPGVVGGVRGQPLCGGGGGRTLPARHAPDSICLEPQLGVGPRHQQPSPGALGQLPRPSPTPCSSPAGLACPGGTPKCDRPLPLGIPLWAGRARPRLLMRRTHSRGLAFISCPPRWLGPAGVLFPAGHPIVQHPVQYPNIPLRWRFFRTSSNTAHKSQQKLPSVEITQW